GKRIEGCVRHVGVHAAGVVVAPTPLVEWTPVQPDPKGTGKLITQYDMYSITDEYGGVGLLKFDFLGIKNLAILADAVVRVRETRGVEVDIENVPIDDLKTFQMLAAGQTEGTFQLNGSGMTRWLKELRPTTIHDINAMVALYRPGPMETIPQYIERKQNPKLIRFVDPRMKDYLDFSYGLLVYQDDVLLTSITLAGYSWLEADSLRKAMGKKIPAVMQAEKEKLLKGFVEYGKLSKEKAETLWLLIEPFAAYGFHKAHAASYGKVAYQTAYMKANYPVEYLSALLTADSGDTEQIS
ncbi:MAG: DNA polymerase III subunit alpha, partial [Pseudomonadota bacterium]